MKINKYPGLKQLFQRYQDGSIHQHEKELVDEWFEKYTDEDAADILKDPNTEQRIYQELTSRIANAQKASPVRKMWQRQNWLKAACIVFAVSLLAALYFNKRNSETPLTAAVFNTFATGNAQVKKITLDDGTSIWLNAATTMRVSTLFNNTKERVVYLDKGEAFFEVKHDASHPFSVISGKLITRDIGTTFCIRAYDLKNEYRVAVTEGKVDVEQLDSLGKPHIISAGITRGQLLVYKASLNTTQVLRKDTRLIATWRTDGSIHTDAMTLEQIGDELSRHFNIKVTVRHPTLDTRKYTINLGTQNIGQMLQQLTLATGISYKLDADSLIINPSASNMK
jgi:transmembrane sensor